MTGTKRYYPLLVLLFGSLLFLSSCLEEGDDSPFDVNEPSIAVSTTLVTPFDSIEYSGVETEVEPLDQILFEVTINAPGGFSSYSIFLSVDGATNDTLILVSPDDLNAVGSVTTVVDSRTFEIPSELTNTSVVFTFYVKDELEQSGDSKVAFEIFSPKARRYDNVVLSTPSDDLLSTCFFNSTTGMSFSTADIIEAPSRASGIDFGFYYGEQDSASIASPKGFEKKEAFVFLIEGWPILNTTFIRTAAVESIEEILRFEDIDLAYDQSTDEIGIANDLIVGDVVAFETVNGKKGLIQLVDIPVSDDREVKPESITLDIVVQQRTPRN